MDMVAIQEILSRFDAAKVDAVKAQEGRQFFKYCGALLRMQKAVRDLSKQVEKNEWRAKRA